MVTILSAEEINRDMTFKRVVFPEPVPPEISTFNLARTMPSINLPSAGVIVFNQTGVDQAGNVIGHFEVKGVRPKFFDKFVRMGVPLTEELFDENEEPFDED